MAAAVLEREPITAREEEQPVLREIRRIVSPLRGEGSREAMLVGPNDERIPIPTSLFRILRQAVIALQQGEAVAVVPLHKELTTQQAADFLSISRQYLVRLLEKGEIPFTKVGTHRRIKYRDLVSYKQQRDRERSNKLAELARLSQEFGLYDQELQEK